ncbi:MAG: carbon-nitrogen hydrolase family protein [Candidatus Thermoplasmatota archaeon]|nr:carbon-nitrogen hydrolase family protein [Candidatus Thermoplasmatota archaeon]MBS3789747.1 carbon-nitrogen hydrolase family protein [Candidatus Thermoplasmatota archaeon]
MDEILNVLGLQFDYAENSIPFYDKIKGHLEGINLEGVDLVCFPESCIYGFDYDVLSGAEENDFEKQIGFFKEIAKQNDINVIAGLVEKDGENYFNTAMVFDREGKVLHKYRKNYLWAEEKKFFTPGSSYGVVELEGWKIGLGLCADLGFPEFSRSLALKGAEFLVFPSAWRGPYDRLWELMLTARAAENQAYVLGLNVLGSENNFCGNSVAVAPSGDVIKKLGKDEGFLSFELNKEDVFDRREEIGWLFMPRAEIYRKLGNG